MTEKVLRFLIYKNRKSNDISIAKWAKHMNRAFTEEEI